MNVYFALRELMFQIDEISKQTNIITINSKSVIKKNAGLKFKMREEK